MVRWTRLPLFRVWAACQILLRRDVWGVSLAGACLAFLTTTAGSYGFFFENRALDVTIGQARFEAAMAIARPDAPCAMADGRSQF